MHQEEIQVARSSLPPFDEYIEEIRDLWDSHRLTNMGPKHKELENLLKDYLQCDRISMYVNGHSALEGIIEALELGADGRNKVITTPFTFASTTHAIVRKGLVPVFADIDPVTLTLSPESIESVLDADVCAILPVHVYGNLCDIDAIQRIADKNSLKVIYDAAHAFGVSQDGIGAARFGDASIFSFHATKVFNTIEGGAVCFSDPALEDTLNQWKNFGITGPESVEYVGGNAKMNEFAAAMGLCNLRHVDDEIAKRSRIDTAYRELLDSIEGVRVVSQKKPGLRSNFSYLPVLFDEPYGNTRDEVFSHLKQAGINPRKYFYPLVPDYDCYRDDYDSSLTPVAKDASNKILTLPIYADLELDDVRRICNLIAEHAR